MVRRTSFAILIYLALCFAGGVFLANITLHPQRRVLDANSIPLSAATNVTLTVADGTQLRAWYIHSDHENNDAVLLLHGLSDNRLGMIGYAQLLLAHGYSVLMPDSRAHGDSGGPIATYGLLERNDIHQWLTWLTQHEHPHCIFGLGESMGAAELLQSVPNTGFCAVAAESPFSSFREIAYDRVGQFFHTGPWLGRTLFRPLIETAFLYTTWRYRLRMDQVSPEAAVRTTHVPIFLIHGRNDRNIPVRHSRRLHAADPAIVLWEVPDTDHCGAISTHPVEFQIRLLAWFASHDR